MKIPVRQLNIARLGDSDSVRYNLDRMKLDRVDGHNVSMATDGYCAIVSAKRTEEEMPQTDGISRDDAALAIDVAAAIGVEHAKVLSPEVLHVGGIKIYCEPIDGRYPDLLKESQWSTLSDDKAVSVVVNIKRLRQLLEILSDAMPDDPTQAMVMTVSPGNDMPIVFTSESDGVFMASTLCSMSRSNVPAWNPSDLKEPEHQPESAIRRAPIPQGL